MKEERKQELLAQANALTQSRYDFSVIEKRCLYLIIQEVRHRYIDTHTGQKDLFDNMYLQIPASTICKLGDEAKDVYTALKKLSNREIEIETEDVWVFTHWVMTVRHDKKKNIYNIDVSREIMPFLVALAEEFTTYDLTVAISLRSTYSQRFYEFCSQYKNRTNKSFFFTIEKLREMLKIENKYKNGSDFKKYVLDVAQKELKELYDKGGCELWFEFHVKDTDKRKILSYAFFIHTKDDEQQPLDYQEVAACLQRISSILNIFFPRDKKFVKRVIQEIQLRPDIAFELLSKLDKKVLDYDKKEIPPIIRYVLGADFGIK